MRYILFILAFSFTSLHAQSILKFDKRFVECEDKWVAFQMNKDSSYTFGFIYIDSQAGLTLDYHGNFRILDNGLFVARTIDTANIKVRLEPNNVRVALIPECKFEELKIKAIPDWLGFYKTDTASIERLYRWGFMYNGWNECEKALRFLKKAKLINPKFHGLEVELAYSYNCLGNYDNAIIELQGALETNPTDAYVNKELIYAQIKSGQLNKAAESCRKAIEVCSDKSYNGENCYNLLHAFYLNNDKSNFNLWIDETKKWIVGNSNLVINVQIMENDLKK